MLSDSALLTKNKATSLPQETSQYVGGIPEPSFPTSWPASRLGSGSDSKILGWSWVACTGKTLMTQTLSHRECHIGRKTTCGAEHTEAKESVRVRREIFQCLSQPTVWSKVEEDDKVSESQNNLCNAKAESPKSYLRCLVVLAYTRPVWRLLADNIQQHTTNRDSTWTCSPCNFIYLFHTADIDLVIHIQAFHIPSITLHGKGNIATKLLNGIMHQCHMGWW